MPGSGSWCWRYQLRRRTNGPLVQIAFLFSFYAFEERNARGKEVRDKERKGCARGVGSQHEDECISMRASRSAAWRPHWLRSFGAGQRQQPTQPKLFLRCRYSVLTKPPHPQTLDIWKPSLTAASSSPDYHRWYYCCCWGYTTTTSTTTTTTAAAANRGGADRRPSPLCREEAPQLAQRSWPAHSRLLS